MNKFMLFNSYAFIFVFLPIVLSVCFILARYLGPAASQLWLIAASLYFYASWNVIYLPLLLGSILFNYWIAIRMVRQPEQTRRLYWMMLAVAVDLGLLGYYKYTNFLLGTIDDLTGTNFVVATIILPLGISFYTFQQITLLVDISSGLVTEFRFRDFLLFVIFFPHLIAGPIVHHREMMPQFERASYRFDWSNMAVGVTLFVAGLFKKAVLADGIADQVSPIFADATAGHEVSLVYAWAAAVGFTLQIYFDFSGYSEMALGLARMVGIKLPMNFNSPLKATSIIEYWSRWHITLTRFLTAYLYTPMARSLTRRRMQKGLKGVVGTRTRPAAFATLVGVPMIVTMFLAGLWHGAGYQFLVFGLLHGFYLVINHACRVYRTLIWKDNRSYQAIMKPVGFILTFLGVIVAMTYFHADSVAAATNIVAGLAGLHGVVLPEVIADRLPGVAAVLSNLGIQFGQGSMTLLIAQATWCAALLLIALLTPNVLEIMRQYEPAITTTAPSAVGARLGLFSQLADRLLWKPTTSWAIATAALTACGVLALNHVTAFLYWQF